MNKLLLTTIIAVLSIGLLELGSALLYRAHFKSWYSYQHQKEKVLQVVAGAMTGTFAGADKSKIKLPYPLHPFIGFTGRPGGSRTHGTFNDYGFLGANPVITTAPDQLLVAITGGSVAAELYSFAGDFLKDELGRAYPGKEVIVTGIALGGMKQPQQLMAMNYFLMLGAEFDVIINLDGYNEVVLSLQNHNTGASPFFPRAWRMYAQKSLDVDRALLIADLGTLARRRQGIARLASLPLLNSSAFVGTLWQLLDDRMLNGIFRREKALSEYKVSREDSPQVAGPIMDYGDTADTEELVLDVWENSSRQMSRLAGANSIEYYHFLQPNQYYADSKPLSREEMALTLTGDPWQGDVVSQMYPKLVARLAAISELGDIQIFDLTQIYVDNNDTLYVDNCCHLNERGYKLMASAIVDQIASAKEELSESPAHHARVGERE